MDPIFFKTLSPTNTQQSNQNTTLANIQFNLKQQNFFIQQPNFVCFDRRKEEGSGGGSTAEESLCGEYCGGVGVCRIERKESEKAKKSWRKL